MSDDISGDGPASALARLGQLIDELQSFDWTSVPGEQLLTVLRDLDTQKRRLAPVEDPDQIPRHNRMPEPIGS